jgi:hypothetical protein
LFPLEKVSASRAKAFFIERLILRSGCMMLFLRATKVSKWGRAMAKPVPTKCVELQTANELDQRSKDLLSDLRKPLKPTATLRRRALKNKAAVTFTIPIPTAPSRT